ncbi:hypothetical protein HDU84_004685 [Entophlyctis sp. JEL0112]|nr:hypothetical protein HDU84_004685 [Entophlyctis sp. JEL0112]
MAVEKSACQQVLKIPELMERIAVFLPPLEIQRIGQLNRFTHCTNSFHQLIQRRSFAVENFKEHSASLKRSAATKYSSEGQLLSEFAATVNFFIVGVYYLAAFFDEFGFRVETLSVLQSATRQGCLHVGFNQLRPDAFHPPAHKPMVHAALILSEIWRQQRRAYGNLELPCASNDSLVILWLSALGAPCAAAMEVMQSAISGLLVNPPPFLHSVQNTLGTAFVFACSAGHENVVRALAGCGIFSMRPWGDQAVWEAVLFHKIAIVEFLVEELNADDYAGAADLAFQCAWNCGKTNILKCMLQRKARVSPAMLATFESDALEA